MVFTDTLWPDFNLDKLEQALSEYNRRERRFGQLGSNGTDTDVLTKRCGNENLAAQHRHA